MDGLAMDQIVHQGIYCRCSLTVGMLCDEHMDMSAANGIEILFKSIESDHAHALESTFPDIFRNNMDSRIEHHDSNVSGGSGKGLVQFPSDVFRTLRIYEYIYYLSVWTMSRHIFHESGPSCHCRVGIAHLVPFDTHHQYLFKASSVSHDIGAKISALEHRHAEIGKITVVFKF